MCVDVLLIFALLLCFCIVQSPPSPPLLVGIPNPIILMSIAFNRVVFGLSTPGIKGIGYFYRGIGYFYRCTWCSLIFCCLLKSCGCPSVQGERERLLGQGAMCGFLHSHLILA